MAKASSPHEAKRNAGRREMMAADFAPLIRATLARYAIFNDDR